MDLGLVQTPQAAQQVEQAPLDLAEVLVALEVAASVAAAPIEAGRVLAERAVRRQSFHSAHKFLLRVGLAVAVARTATDAQTRMATSKVRVAMELPLYL
jgi:hypothetical protein